MAVCLTQFDRTNQNWNLVPRVDSFFQYGGIRKEEGLLSLDSIVPSTRTTLDTLWCLHKTIPYIGENAPTIVTGVKYRKKWSKCLAFINCYLCHFIYVNQNQTPVIEREILPFWTTESKAEKFSAAVKYAKEKTPGSYRCFAHSCDFWDYRIY